ncbi:MAG: efflux RND transporter periplasmic adaptor subunit [Pseudomonadota bacterium]
MAGGSTEKRQPFGKWFWLLIAALFMVAAGGAYWWLSRSSDAGAASTTQPAPLIETTEIKEADDIILRQTGFVRAADAVEVVPQITERIVEISAAFAEGNRVTRGDPLIRLDATSAEADNAAAQARVKQAEAALNEARITLNRQEQLRRESVVSEAALEDAQVALARAQADLAMANAEQSRAELTLGDTVLNAPFDAIVTSETASVGQLVQAGASLGRLVAIDKFEVEMGVLQAELAPAMSSQDTSALIGTSVGLIDPATGRDLGEGRVAAVLPEIDTRTRTVRLLVHVPRPFDGADVSVRLGELVELAIALPVENGPALSVRAEAIKGGDTLWRVSDGTLSRVPIEILSRDGATVSLRADGLTAGDRVMLSDLAAPAEGLAVRVPDATMQTAQGG